MGLDDGLMLLLRQGTQLFQLEREFALDHSLRKIADHFSGSSSRTISLGSQWRRAATTCGLADQRVCLNSDRERPRLTALARPIGHVAGTAGNRQSMPALEHGQMS